MSSPVKTSRPYRSERRAADAAATRVRILDAAAALFARQGYAATRMQQIAAEAGVAVDTVYANGSKRSLFLAAYERTFSGQEGKDPLNERPELQALAQVPDPEALFRGFVRYVAERNRASAPLWPALRGAAHADPDIAADFADLLARRHTGFLEALRVFEERGLLAPARSIDALAHALEFLMSPDGYEELVLRGGLAMEDYEEWLAGQVRAALDTAR